MACVFLPFNLSRVVSLFAPVDMGGSILGILPALVNPALPLAGIFLMVLVFLQVLMRNTKAYGPVLTVAGIGFMAYVYLAFWGGTIQTTLPTDVTMGLSTNLAVNLTVLMLIVMALPLLATAKGFILTFGAPRGSSRRV